MIQVGVVFCSLWYLVEKNFFDGLVGGHLILAQNKEIKRKQN